MASVVKRAALATLLLVCVSGEAPAEKKDIVALSGHHHADRVLAGSKGLEFCTNFIDILVSLD